MSHKAKAEIIANRLKMTCYNIIPLTVIFYLFRLIYCVRLTNQNQLIFSLNLFIINTLVFRSLLLM